MSSSSEIHAFWQAFAAAEPALQSVPLRERVEQGNDILSRHMEGLALEMLGGDDGEAVELVVTAHGSHALFPLLMQVVSAAPPLRHHRVSAFRQRMAQSDFGIGMAGFNLATSDVLIACAQDAGQIALEIRWAREVSQDEHEHARHMSFILLDHVLGEYDFAVKVGAVDFIDGEAPADHPGPWTPLSQFPAVFDAYWRDALGRTGDFPLGEHDWSGLTLAFHPQDGEEDGGDDAPEDTALVMVNRSANAVAMRADLTHALRLALPVNDRDALDAVRDLQEQAATLLAASQLGILACTITRGGTREAIYYVGDRAQAEQALAPLLARPQAAAHELDVTFDPAWSGYFEYAALA